MSNENWMEQYKKWRLLKPHQLKLLDEGAKTQSQAWLINNMWCEWKNIKKIKETELPSLKDPWDEDFQEVSDGACNLEN